MGDGANSVFREKAMPLNRLAVVLPDERAKTAEYRRSVFTPCLYAAKELRQLSAMVFASFA
jgi:hypothetical protein